MASLTFLNFSFGYFTCNNFVVENGDFDKCRVLLDEETTRICYILNLCFCLYHILSMKIQLFHFQNLL
jgi:hypothetical protein